MSFFIKSKLTNGASRFSADNRRKRRAAKFSKKNDEITSSEDEDNEAHDRSLVDQSSEDEHETAQEKKLRLARIYLEEIEREERQRLEDDEVSKEVISQRLRADHLKQLGKYENTVADKYKEVDPNSIYVMKCREQHRTLTCLCISTDDEWVFVGSKEGVVVKWALKERKKLGIIPFVKSNVNQVKGHTGSIHSIAVSTDSQFLVVGDSSGFIQIWDPRTLTHIDTLKGHKKPVTGLALKHNTHTLYSASEDQTIRVWSLDEMAFVEALLGHQEGITSIDVLNSDRPVSAGGQDGTIRLWKVNEETQLVFNAHPTIVDIVKMINEQHFISGGDDGNITIWSCLKKKPLCSVKEAHSVSPVNGVPHWISAVSSYVHSDLVVSGSQDGFIKFWKLQDRYRNITKLIEVPIIGFINDLSFTSDGKFLVAAVGKEHKFGRWTGVPDAINGVHVIPLQRNDST